MFHLSFLFFFAFFSFSALGWISEAYTPLLGMYFFFVGMSRIPTVCDVRSSKFPVRIKYWFLDSFSGGFRWFQAGHHCMFSHDHIDVA